MTTVALLMAALWPAPLSLLVEADPSGGDVATWFRLSDESGLVSLAAETRRVTDLQTIWFAAHTRDLSSDLFVVPAPADAEVAHGAIRLLAMRPEILEVPLVDPDGPSVVVVDLGRLTPVSPAWPLAAQLDGLVIVCGGKSSDLVRLAIHLPALQQRLGWRTWIGALVRQPCRYGKGEAEASLGVPVLGFLPDDPATAASLDVSAGRRLGLKKARSSRPLVLQVRALTASLQDSARRPVDSAVTGDVQSDVRGDVSAHVRGHVYGDGHVNGHLHDPANDRANGQSNDQSNDPKMLTGATRGELTMPPGPSTSTHTWGTSGRSLPWHDGFSGTDDTDPYVPGPDDPLFEAGSGSYAQHSTVTATAEPVSEPFPADRPSPWASRIRRRWQQPPPEVSPPTAWDTSAPWDAVDGADDDSVERHQVPATFAGPAPWDDPALAAAGIVGRTSNDAAYAAATHAPDPSIVLERQDGVPEHGGAENHGPADRMTADRNAGGKDHMSADRADRDQADPDHKDRDHSDDGRSR